MILTMFRSHLTWLTMIDSSIISKGRMHRTPSPRFQKGFIYSTLGALPLAEGGGAKHSPPGDETQAITDEQETINEKQKARDERRAMRDKKGETRDQR